MPTVKETSYVPVLLLTGFLGSGKTSLLNRMMKDWHPERGKMAIVVNELGEVGIDGDLLPAEMTRQVELPGGCICCVLNEDLDRTILELLRSYPEVAMIVIETTGIAEPLPICWALEREPLNQRVRLSAVVTVIDAMQFEESRKHGAVAEVQVEEADILIPSKLDLLPEGRMPDELRAVIRELNPTAPLFIGSRSEVVSLLWRTLTDPELPAATAENRQARKSSATQEPASAELHRDHDHDHDHAHGHPHQGPEHGQNSIHGFHTVWLPIDELIDFEELSSLLEELPSNYVRIKGIARVVDGSTGSNTPHWIAFHRVGTRVSREPFSPAAPSSSAGRVVALGPRVDRQRLAACFDAAVIRSIE